LGQRVRLGKRATESNRLDSEAVATDRASELETLIIHLNCLLGSANFKKPDQPIEQMNYLKKLWTALNTDITPLAQAILKSYSDCHNPYSVVC
jgi:hypothetical protein